MKTYSKKTTFTPILLASSMALLTACSSGDNDTDEMPDSTASEDPANENPVEDDASDENTQNGGSPDADTLDYAFVFTRGPMFQSGQIERISITDGYTVDGTYPATLSDHAVATDGESVYQIGRFSIDTLTKFSAVDTSIATFDISVLNGAENTTNPQALAFVDSDLAYLTRRGSDSLLIIDPTPDQALAESVITGEISLADYNLISEEAAVTPPAMTDAVVVDGKLFVLMENLESFAPNEPGYMAVIDTTTNMEIPTDQSESPRQGIPLQTGNPTSLHYNEATGLLYVTGRGNYFGNPAFTGDDPYNGGIESIDPDSFQTELLVDDGTEENNKGYFIDAVVVNSTLGYLITLDGFNDDFSSINNLRTFNPADGSVSEPIAEFSGLSLTGIEAGPDNHLWVGIQSNTPGFMRIDLDTGIVDANSVATNLIPSNVVFVEDVQP